ncbi:DUF551 domain-containing protein, partial [Citrobacter freundii]|uniref:DUF551 domain-containing protein n=1 Tax=Citrobacter freundii TaxID=546 RepID=UPI000A9710EA
APVVPDEDPRDAFERTFKMPKHVTRCGTGYAVTAYSAWLAHDFVRMWEGWNACRAAMLQGADVSLTHEGKNHHEDKLGMVNHLGDVTEKVEPVTQIEPVADLYGLTSSTGGETSFTFDAVEARDFIDGGWSCQEYVELERFQEAVSGNSPVIQDGWVACVERMPSAGEKVLAYRPDAPESNDPLIKMATYVGGSAHGHGFDCYCKPTHWMPLPAAPQQEAE